NEVKMTIIATGFPSAEASQEKEAAVSAALNDVLGDEEALDLPPFLRHHRAARSRSVRKVAASD
ncbi:MAG: hypothetical protein CL731_08200, partial [Chloroflexi bacterium]|nr:hypothetical protein [Chloroflexota bacterium]